MSQKIVLLAICQLPAWDAFVLAHPFGTIYHTSAWRQLIAETYGHQPLYFATLTETGQIVAGLPAFLIRSNLTGTRLSTLPCAQSCNPLVSSKEQYEELKRFILNYMAARHIVSWEIKMTHFFRHEQTPFPSEPPGFMTHVLNIESNPETLFSSFHKNCVQRSIKKAHRCGLALKRCESSDAISEFYRLYVQMRRTNGLLPLPRLFFEALWKILKPDNRIAILFAEYKMQYISAILLLKYKDAVVYEYGATGEGMHQYSPSPFLLWEGILQAVAEGYKYFDFGRTAVTETGLEQFKGHWGAERQDLLCLNMTPSAQMSSIRRSSKARALMGLAMRIMPESACDWASRTLYKHLV